MQKEDYNNSNQNYPSLHKIILSNKNPFKAKIHSNFFKTKKGEYGEGDIHLGITVPKTREIAKQFLQMSPLEIQKTLDSNIHSERLCALLILVKQFQIAQKNNNEIEMKNIFDFYLKNTNNINNWDFVDLSAPNIVGNYLLKRKKEREILYDLAKSNKKGKNDLQWLWEKRIAIIATYSFIKNKELGDTYKLSKMLLNEEHDLMHKAVGWMLREAGKKNEKRLLSFLKENYTKLPRTTLRYAIEKFEETKRKELLKGIFN